MDIVANTLLAAGASPAMIHSLAEIPDFTPQAQALCVNVGTLSPSWVPAMKSAAELMVKLGKPWVLDPVAAGASGFRLNACLALVGVKPTVIRGNGSEIIALSRASLGVSKVFDEMSSWVVLVLVMTKLYAFDKIVLVMIECFMFNQGGRQRPWVHGCTGSSQIVGSSERIHCCSVGSG
ncbi:unnamed protein product [Linum tenue]|uniref:hydroxyethylthiazole kinase n=1 Tax=Linum tenue TaxID=586396 RepID=A0AAV0LSC4_9ROSI|nr:unnamed protein product [Linum tenue]